MGFVRHQLLICLLFMGTAVASGCASATSVPAPTAVLSTPTPLPASTTPVVPTPTSPPNPTATVASSPTPLPAPTTAVAPTSTSLPTFTVAVSSPVAATATPTTPLPTDTPAPPATPTISVSGDPANGARLFASLPCGSCHDINSPYPGGDIAPNLGNVATEAVRIVKSADYRGKAIDAAGYIRESIVDPNAYIVPGDSYHTADGQSVMLKDFGQILKPSEIDDLVTFLLQKK
jgi:cytochrome c2